MPARVQNLSTRGAVSTGDNVLINGFIISGSDPATIVIRALGPSLAGFGLSGVLADPVLNLYNSSGVLVKTNDNWHDDFGAAFMQATGLAPSNPFESAALLRNLPPGAYTVVVTGKNSTEGISLAEVYEIPSPGLNSQLTNVSGRGFVGTGDNVLISGFIIGDVDSATVVVRALGPSLGAFGVSNPLSDPVLTIYDSKGNLIATNDNWQDNNNANLVQRNGLAPPNALESAIVLHLPAGAYTAAVTRSERGYRQCFSRSLPPPLVPYTTAKCSHLGFLARGVRFLRRDFGRVAAHIVRRRAAERGRPGFSSVRWDAIIPLRV